MAIDGKPTVGGSDGTWGATLNSVLDALNPTTTKGDLVYATSSSSAGNGVPGRLGVGAASSILTVGAASALQWSSSMNLSGAATIGGLLTMSNSASLTGTLTINAPVGNDTTPEIKMFTASSNLSLYTAATASGFNNLVSASDSALIFYGSVQNSGGLTIAPWASVTTGIRITASNTIALYGSTTLSGGTTSISSSLTVGGTASITGNVSISSGLLSVVTGTSGSLTLGDATITKTNGQFFNFNSGASLQGLYATSGSINGTLNATVLQQGSAAVPTITTTAKMAQGIATGNTTASGVLNIATGLTTVTNIIVSNGASAQNYLVSSASSYSGGNASVIVRVANTSATLNAGAASVNWIAFGT